MQEEGKLIAMKKKWWMEGMTLELIMHTFLYSIFFFTDNACDVEKASETDETAALEMANVGGCFLVLLGGVVIAVLLGICEFLWNVHRISVEQNVGEL